MNGTVNFDGESVQKLSKVMKDGGVSGDGIVDYEEGQSLSDTDKNDLVIEENKNDSRREDVKIQENRSNRQNVEKERDQLQDKRSKSYDDVTEKNANVFDKQLLEIPTELDSNGNEIVVFDEVMVAEGSKRWEKTLCGYFVGYGMSVNELRYNLRKMWSRYGFKDIIDFKNGDYFMKFNSEEGLEFIVNNGPWMVKNKPLIVQKWDINGISALASRVGRPLVMDNVTASMCKMGIGRVGFARVLVEVNANKPLPDEIKIVYKNGSKEEICRKTVKVLYDWKPPCRDNYCVFGHFTRQCGRNKDGVRTEESRQNDTEEKRKMGNLSKDSNDGNADSEGFIPVQKRKNGDDAGKINNPYYKHNTQHPRFVNQKNNVNGKANVQYEFQPKKNVSNETLEPVIPKEATLNNTSGSQKSADENDLNKIQNMKSNEKGEKSVDQRKDQMINKGEEVECGKCCKNKEVEDVYNDDTGMGECMAKDVLETHIKAKSLNKIGDRIFETWDWYSNMNFCDKGCRIMVGIDRRWLWKDLQVQKRIVGDSAWIMMGDMNVYHGSK
ncbi:zinc knuckle CX2CX4HX4C containing protein [Tanacetum coccineum]